MPMQIVENPNASSRLFGALGSGLGEGLAQLAKHKIGEIQQQKVAQNFQKAFNVSPDYAQALAQLQQSDPGSFHHFVSQLGGGTPPGQALPEGQEPQYNTFQPKKSEEENVPLMKHRNSIREQLKNLDSTLDITKNIEELLHKPDIELGIWPNIKGNIAPSKLNKNTEDLQKYADQYLEAKIKGFTGIRSKNLVDKIERSKIGLQHSKEVNLRQAQEAQKLLKKERDDLIKNNPFLKDYKSEINQEAQQEVKQLTGLPDPSLYEEDKIGTNSKTGQRVIKRNGKWAVYNG